MFVSRRLTTALAVAAIGVCAAPSASFAAGNDQSGPSVGNCISDILYGNEPNIAAGTGGPAEQEPGTKAGRVLPSQSPGPKVTNSDGTVRDGFSVGDFMQAGVDVPELCRAAFGN